jgi:hypothetical protein
MTSRRARRRPRQRGKSLIALLVAAAALAGGAQALAPASAAATIYQDMTEKECNDEFGRWFDGTCEVNIGGGGGSGGPLYGGSGGGGGGSATGNPGGAFTGGTSTNSQKNADQIAAEESTKRLQQLLEQIRKELARRHKRQVCQELWGKRRQVRTRPDNPIARLRYGRSKAEDLAAVDARLENRGCNELP